MKRNKNRGSRQSVYYAAGEEGKCVGIQNKNSRSAPWSLMFLLLDCHILYHLKQELVLFYIAEKDSSGSTLISHPPCQKTSGNVKMSETFIRSLLFRKGKSRIKALRRIEALQC